MKVSENEVSIGAMAFHHGDGLPSAWQQAINFADENGRLATMPDIVAARLTTRPEEFPWENYFTTLTAEYFGISKNGKHILIIAHGVGPMSSLKGIMKAYSWEYKDKERRRRGGRITQQEFWDLEAGKFGDVSIIDFDSYCSRYEYPFLQTLRLSEALVDPVLKARLGPQAEQYLLLHADYAKEWHNEQASFDPENKYNSSPLNHLQFINRRREQHQWDGSKYSDPYIVKLGDAANCCYSIGSMYQHKPRPIEEGYAIAHLISTGGLTHLCHQDGESLTLDVSCHEWWNGVRLVSIRHDGDVRFGIHNGPDAYKLLRNHWQELFVPMHDKEEVGFRGLVQIDEQWFTQYPKVGERMDTWEPEYAVVSIKKVGKPSFFRTTVGGYHAFFKFGAQEVQAIAPQGANAYSFISKPEIEWNEGNPTHHTCMVQFYQIEVDSTKRMIRVDQLAHDYGTMMKLLNMENEPA
jgi:hypothetical protein